MKKNFIKLMALICVCVVFTTSTFVTEAKDSNLTADKVVKDIRVGWNLGNTLDNCDNNLMVNGNSYRYETLKGNPLTTKEMIMKVKAAGFNAIRIPVTYYNHIDESGVIDKTWLARIEQIVQYGLNADMYVIINIHHDTGKGVEKAIQANYQNIAMYQAYVETIWRQVATYFKDYDNRLIFEGMNETLDMSAQNPWYGNESSWKAMNMLNQTFVNTVRTSGGNNNNRVLVVNTYGAQTTYGPVNYFEMPDDTVANRLIVGVHTYVSSEKDIKNFMGELNSKFVSKGYPVIVGEFATAYWDEINFRTGSAIHFMNYGNMYGIKCFWWDDGGNYRLLNRKTNGWYYPQIVEGMMYAIEVANSKK